jgi:NTP pyrophosphatase (non-canonical NTP hydrolase)
MLNEIGKEIGEINRANGWEAPTPQSWADPYRIPAALALITSETSEALEGWRHDDHKNFAEELADVLIRVLDLADGLKIDLDRAVAEKLEANKRRGWKHGGKRL